MERYLIYMKEQIALVVVQRYTHACVMRYAVTCSRLFLLLPDGASGNRLKLYCTAWHTRNQWEEDTIFAAR